MSHLGFCTENYFGVHFPYALGDSGSYLPWSSDSTLKLLVLGVDVFILLRYAMDKCIVALDDKIGNFLSINRYPSG